MMPHQIVYILKSIEIDGNDGANVRDSPVAIFEAGFEKMAVCEPSQRIMICEPNACPSASPRCLFSLFNSARRRPA